jgi:hypothetical protein
MCRQAVSDSNGGDAALWIRRWYSPPRLKSGFVDEGDPPPHPIDVLEERTRETVTLAAEAGGEHVRAADAAFEAFIAAANVINKTVTSVTAPASSADIVRARKAVNYLATGSRALESLAPPGQEEPVVVGRRGRRRAAQALRRVAALSISG